MEGHTIPHHLRAAKIAVATAPRPAVRPERSKKEANRTARKPAAGARVPRRPARSSLPGATSRPGMACVRAFLASG